MSLTIPVRDTEWKGLFPSGILVYREIYIHGMADSNETAASGSRRIWLLIGLSALAALLLVLVMHGVHLVSPRSIDTAIDQDLGPESDLGAVRQFMDSRHILYTGYSPELRRAYGKVYRSSIGLMDGHILIQFNFSEEGKLISHKAVEHYEFAWE